MEAYEEIKNLGLQNAVKSPLVPALDNIAEFLGINNRDYQARCKDIKNKIIAAENKGDEAEIKRLKEGTKGMLQRLLKVVEADAELVRNAINAVNK